ncbi:YcbK family protein [Desulfopila aestuarii]|uniref:Murein endopeptidase K n=1 Tax=Desulfopila aestuarii DSM 18488 TaxID=1121416 RepID=A0A1M7Y612_9BACT|nr:DUF882 domain-containing protein [Desulfopila aestuarii]SHO48010.1 Uncharacterized conserved protein YcbK, DUF882 family [Desulfopila aestuarii DSM 18488]
MKNRYHILAVVVFVVAFACGLSAAVSFAAEPKDRFFFMGSGKLHLNNLRNNRHADVELLDGHGAINEVAFDKVDWVFGFPTEEKGEHISPRMLFMLSYFSDLVAPGKTIHIESAYRSPEYNDKIRKQGANAAKTSTHIDGMALDFWIEGVDGKELWETVRAKNCCGVGHYGGKEIHLDAGRPRFWEAATSGTGSTEPDNNRHIYLTTQYDRYLPGEKLRLSLSGISTFDFGIRPKVQVYAVDDRAIPLALMALQSDTPGECIKIDTRKATRFLDAQLPTTLAAGSYRVQVDFCEKLFLQMPDNVLSGEIEVIR